MSNNMEVVETLKNGNFIVKIETVIEKEGEDVVITKYALANQGELVSIRDAKGNISVVQMFDVYHVNEAGDIIIGTKKSGREYYDRVLSHFDLSETKMQAVEVPGGPFNIGPYAKQYYEYTYPTKRVEDIVPDELSYNYGLISRDGILCLYPAYDSIVFGNEDTCIVGNLGVVENLDYGYFDLLSKEFLSPICFSRAEKFNDGRALVKHRRCFGYLDRNKVLINPNDNSQYATNLEPKYMRASSFKDGKAIVCLMQATHLTQALKAYIGVDGEIVGFVPRNKMYRKLPNK